MSGKVLSSPVWVATNQVNGLVRKSNTVEKLSRNWGSHTQPFHPFTGNHNRGLLLCPDHKLLWKKSPMTEATHLPERYKDAK